MLDLGCGTGIFPFLLEQYRPKRILGIDLSDEMLKIAKEKTRKCRSNAEFILGDPTNAFDSVQTEFEDARHVANVRHPQQLPARFSSGLPFFPIMRKPLCAIFPPTNLSSPAYRRLSCPDAHFS